VDSNVGLRRSVADAKPHSEELRVPKNRNIRNGFGMERMFRICAKRGDEIQDSRPIGEAPQYGLDVEVSKKRVVERKNKCVDVQTEGTSFCN